jgi:ABC-type sugar transport system ATPase subunit
MGDRASTTAVPLLRMAGIEKDFPGVRALAGVDLELQAGEVLGLLGENGAGKSTLIKILGGAHRPDAGSVEMNGQPINIGRPADAQRAGIAVIYQEFNLVPGLSARGNIFLGQENTRAGFIAADEERRRVRALFDRLGAEIDPETRCSELSIAEQQEVEIAKALARDARLIVMDEPSSALSPTEVARLLVVVRELAAQSIGVIYISHRLDEIFEIADRVTVLRDGAEVGTRPIGEFTRESMIELMVGRKLDQEFPKIAAEIGEERLVVEGLARGRRVREVSFGIRRGEVLGLTGLVGAGRTETARLIFGADPREAGTITLDGKPLPLRSPREAVAAGICLLPEDRKTQGLVLGQSVRENFGLPNLASFARLGFIDTKREAEALDAHVDKLQIKLSSADQSAGTLSGGNQQKVVLAKWLERNAEVIIFDEPTRGIDVGAKYEIYQLINRLAAAGKAILMISSELPEVLGMSDRILVMHEGRVTGEITDVAGATQADLMRLAVGQTELAA